MNKLKSILFPFFFLCLGLFLVPLNIYGPSCSKIPGDLGDARFNNYILEHNYKFFTGQVDKYWDAPFMYPYKNVLAFSDNLLGSAPIYAAFRMSGADRESAFQYWLLTLFVLNFICCYWPLIKWSGNQILSTTGAYIFSFSILLVGNIYNVQTYPRFVVPLVFYWSWIYFNQKEIKYFLLVCLGIVFQFFCGIYLGFLLLYALLFLFTSYLIVYKDLSFFTQLKDKLILRNHLLIVLLTSILFFPFILPYISISQHAGVPSFEEVKQYIPTIRSYFFTDKAPVFWSALSEHAVPVIKNWWCHFLFIGALPWLGILAIPFVLFNRNTESPSKKFILFLLLSLFLSFIFCLNINGFTLYQLIYKLPGFSAMRSMNRIINIEIMFFILIFVFVFYELSKQHAFIKWILIFFPVFAILDNAIHADKILSYDKKESQDRILAIRNVIQTNYQNETGAIAYLPDTIGNPVYFHIDVMLACQELNIACVNAYTGHNPGQYNDFFAQSNIESLTSWCEFNQIKSESILQIHPQAANSNQKIFPRTVHVNLIAFGNKFVSMDEVKADTILANRNAAYEWERFELSYLSTDTVVLKNFKSKFINIDLEKSKYLLANVDSIDQASKLTLIKQDDGTYGLKTQTGEYVCADQDFKGKLIGNRSYIGDWEKFKIIEIKK
jgi:hypothetical protein